ncbi:MAG TPA: 2TM domain-containing protein [Solirubrobacterales bacterium]|nr:2TM domain-containing protein [Solirubrobacterales bacterium]
MPAEIQTNGQPSTLSGDPEQIEPDGQRTLRELATERIHRIRRFKLHLVVFTVGLPLLGALWVLTEYFEENTWPSRFASDPDVAGTWDPWLFFVAGIWTIGLAIHALRTYLGPPIGPIGRYIRRPIPATELDREIQRLKSRR